MSDPYLNYWIECIACAADEGGIDLTHEQVLQLAEGAQGGHENYGQAFYSPPASDRINVIESEWQRKYYLLKKEFDKYTQNAETAVRQALGIHESYPVTIHEYGEVQRHGGRTDRVQ